MKCLNPLKTLFTVWPIGEVGLGGGGCQNVHLNQSCSKFDEMPISTKKIFFHCLASGGRCQNVHLNES